MTTTNWILKIDKFRRSKKGNMDYTFGGQGVMLILLLSVIVLFFITT